MATIADEAVAVVAESVKPAEATSMSAAGTSQVLPSSRLLPYQVGQGDQLQPSQPVLRPLVTHQAPTLPQTNESRTGHWLSALVGGFVYRRRH